MPSPRLPSLRRMAATATLVARLAVVLVLMTLPTAVAFCPRLRVGATRVVSAGSSVITTRTTLLLLLATTKPSPLAQEGDWSAYLDQENTGLVYYFNGKTGQSLWEPPTNTFPAVLLDAPQRQAARKQRKAYFGTKADAKNNNNKQNQQGGGGFFGKRTRAQDTTTEAMVDTSRTDGADEGSWFDGIFTEKEQKETQEEETPDSSSGFFGNILGTSSSPEERNGSAAGEPDSQQEENQSFVNSIFGIGGGTAATATKPQVGKEEGIFTQRVLDVDMSSVVLPHPEKVLWGGEDAVFTAPRTFGVFDGVSGAEKLDGVPLYSTTLASEMKRLLGDSPATITDLTKMLAEAADYADAAATGASTAVVASIDTKGFLRVLNLGDSGCFVIRNDKLVAKTREIVHYFDCPFQLSEDSPDRPSKGTKLNVELLQGDIVVMASDGVFDNLSETEILNIVTSSPSKAATIAKRIADRSRKVSLDEKAMTPYAKLAKRNGFEDFQDGVGGKVDDISCVVVRCT